ncbi:MAG: hypothetical protein HY823_10235 [Acidobacteria bacterium]|nr:hypothetical protein [Acidobacteriota bacterium]
MRTHSGSLLRNLEFSFGAVTFLLFGLMALFMDHALHLALEQEDAFVMQAEAAGLAKLLERGELPLEEAPRPEKSEWRVVDRNGRPLHESLAFRVPPGVLWPEPDADPEERWMPDGRPMTLKVAAISRGRKLQLAMDRSHEEVLFVRFRKRVVLGLASAVLISALLGRWITRRGLAPLGRIVAEAGDIHPLRLERRLDRSQFPEELGELVGTLNVALDRIQLSFERLQRFSGELAHELRTPLQNVRAEVEGLLLRPRDGRAQQEALGSILEECDRLASLIEQTLFLSRTEDPAAAIKRTPILVREVCQRVAAYFDATAEESGIHFEVETEPGLKVFADEGLLQRALTNLVSNALRHTPEGGRVCLGGFARQPGVRLFVKDTGPGVDPELLGRLGEPWVKGHPSSCHGLGLAIVRGILRLHGGSVQFLSSPGEGLEVRLDFPGAPHQALPAEAGASV